MNLYKTLRSEVCADLETLYKNAQILPDGKDVPLSKTIKNIHTIYDGFESTSMVLFTASGNQTDINLAGDTLKTYDDPGVTAVYSWGNQTDLDLAANVDKTICDPKYTAPPVTSAPTTPPMPITTTNGGGYGPLPMGGNYSGCAAISYAKQVKLLNNLNYWKSTEDFMNNMQFQYIGESGTNIEGAIQMAVQNFADPAQHRLAAKKVLIIAASSYSSGDYDDPTQAADSFKNDGGIIITLSYDQTHGLPESLLRNLSTPNYWLTNSVNMHADDMRWLLCEANCFCPTNMKPYNQDAWMAPQGGCHNPVSIPAINRLGERDCLNEWHNGFIAFVEDINKLNFLGSLVAPKSKYWIGLQYINNQWIWPSALGDAKFKINYQSWGAGEPQLSKGNCVYMYQASGFGYSWFVDSCNADYNYICQASPCHSMSYCPYIKP
ncbi:hypothetical protein WR25_15536 [Diploscapter pachys]|uniref:C-type lectin domain-containing protein n=1 Tax=Diploscapter pachys TaxID=2018661 RepID=A0A2A2JHM4_9BILA|nr:hypothetical protein WR25_15536 [Diploscapter pachys]